MSGLVRASSARMEHNRILAQKIREQRTVIKEQRMLLANRERLLLEVVETLRDMPLTVGESLDLSSILNLIEDGLKSEGLTRASGSE